MHARRRFVEAGDLLKTPGRPHEALAFWLDNAVHSVLPKNSLEEAVHYALKHGTALTAIPPRTATTSLMCTT